MIIDILTGLLGIASIIWLSFPLRWHRRMKREEQEFQEVLQGNSERLQSAAMHLYLDMVIKASKTEIPIYEQPMAMYPEQQEDKQ